MKQAKVMDSMISLVKRRSSIRDVELVEELQEMKNTCMGFYEEGSARSSLMSNSNNDGAMRRASKSLLSGLANFGAFVVGANDV